MPLKVPNSHRVAARRTRQRRPCNCRPMHLRRMGRANRRSTRGTEVAGHLERHRAAAASLGGPHLIGEGSAAGVIVIEEGARSGEGAGGRIDANSRLRSNGYGKCGSARAAKLRPCGRQQAEAKDN